MAREKGMGNLQREKSGRWTMRVGIGGKRYCRSTRTKDRDQAERVLQRFLAPFGLGTNRLPLADVWLEYVKSPNRNELSKATLHGKRQVWMQFAKWMEHFYLPVKDLAGITSGMIGEYLACVRAEVSASTYNCRVCVLREIFHVLADKAGLEYDPWEGVRLRPDDSHSRRELTMDELRRLLVAAKKVKNQGEGERRRAESSFCETEKEVSVNRSPSPSTFTSSSEWHTLFLIGIYTGLRLGDCCRLDWSQINLAQGVIQLMPQKTKRHHQRIVTIPIHPTLGQALLDQVEKKGGGGQRKDSGLICSDAVTNIESNLHRSPSPLSFTSFTGPVLPTIAEAYTHAHWKINHTLKRIFKAANITTSVRIEGRRTRTPEATFHSLRHTFVSFAANAGVPLHIVQSIVGHESTAMTRHYYHENLTALKSAVAAIPTL